jgi:uncharacterized membrane protein
MLNPGAVPSRSFEQRAAHQIDALLGLIGRRWLGTLNVLVALFVLGAIAAPLLAASGATMLADPIYTVYHAACHQWAFRSFFFFGAQAVYSPDQLVALNVDPYTFVGSSATGWKMAFCERDLAIYVSLLVFGLLYATRWRPRGLHGMPFLLYIVAAAPLAVDGVTQLFGWRESTWELRVLTGVLFGLASGWLFYPRAEAALNPRTS